MKNKDLSPKRQRFVEEYLKDCNGTQAAIRAGYSPKTANEQAARLLANDSVKAAVEEAMQKRSEEAGVTARSVLEELARIAFLDPAELFDANGNLKDIHAIPEHARRAIASIETRLEGGKRDGQVPELITKIRLVDKRGSLELLGKHLGMWIERHQHEGSGFQLIIHPPAAPKQIEGADNADARKEVRSGDPAKPTNPPDSRG